MVIPAGAASITIAVTPLADMEEEPLETVLVTLASGSYVVGTPASASMNLGDDPLPRISVIAVDGAASELGSDTALLRFSRTGPPDLGARLPLYRLGLRRQRRRHRLHARTSPAMRASRPAAAPWMSW